MPEADTHIVPEEGYGMGYQESVDIETRTLHGMKPDEFYRRQVGLVVDNIPASLSGEEDTEALQPRKVTPDLQLLGGKTLAQLAKEAQVKLIDSCNLDLGDGKRVLDLAVGEGDTSRYLSTTGAKVEARELEKYLVQRARERDTELRERQPGVDDVVADTKRNAQSVLGKVNYARGDYGKIKESVPEGEKFDAITCLSQSFIYLGERENYVKALQDFKDLLVPGGKVVLQGRARNTTERKMPWSDRTGTATGQTPEGHYIMRDVKTGTSFVWRSRESERTLSDGGLQTRGSRYLKYADGSIKELGPVVNDYHLNIENLPIMAEILREAGFINVGIKVENLSENGEEIMYAIVAEKPDDNKIAGEKAGVDARIRGLLDESF